MSIIRVIISGLVFMVVTVIGPDDVKPGDWFTPTQIVQVQPTVVIDSNKEIN